MPKDTAGIQKLLDEGVAFLLDDMPAKDSPEAERIGDLSLLLKAIYKDHPAFCKKYAVKEFGADASLENLAAIVICGYLKGEVTQSAKGL